MPSFPYRRKDSTILIQYFSVLSVLAVDGGDSDNGTEFIWHSFRWNGLCFVVEIMVGRVLTKEVFSWKNFSYHSSNWKSPDNKDF